MPNVDHCKIKRRKSGYYCIVLMDSHSNTIGKIELLSKKKAYDECRRIYLRMGKMINLSDSE